MSMTMSRESIRKQMQEQRPTRKRQLYEVAPSPPKKLLSLARDSPASSPSKGPLVISSDDESPRFRTKSFYGSKKKLILTSSTGDAENHNVLGTPAVSGFSRNTRMSGGRGADKGKETFGHHTVTRQRPALSPIKNVYDNGPKSKNLKKTAVLKAVVNRKRGQSVPPKARLNVAAKLPTEPKTSSEKEHESSTPDKPRKFFKHKSPGSASKASGGIIVEKGFNLKFVRGSQSANGRGSRTTPKTRRPARRGANTKVKKAHGTSTLEMKTQVHREPEDLGSRGKTADGNGAAEMIQSQSGASTSSGVTSDLCDIPTLRTDFQRKYGEARRNRNASNQEDCELMSISSNMSDIIFDEEPEVVSLQSQNLFSCDSQALGSDVSGPVIPSPDSIGTLRSDLSPVEEEHHGKFYSIFSKKRCNHGSTAAESSPSVSSEGTPMLKTRKFFAAKGDDRQLMLDAGQEKFGATQCKVCGMVYSPGDTADEATHYKFHLSALSALKCTGWKKERVIKDFLEDGSRVIVVLPADQRFMVKKVEEVNRVMGQELGFPDQKFSFHGSFKAFLYISDEKRVEGCCIAESVTQGYRILPTTKGLTDSQRPWFCSTEPVKATVGVGRLWVYGPSRKHGIASRLLDCVRQWFEYGFMIPKSQLAFSDPTPDGRLFAAKYTGTPNFLVYKYNHPSD